MKKITAYLILPVLLLFSCEVENIDSGETINEIDGKGRKKNIKNSSIKTQGPMIVKECKVLNADRCNLPGYPQAAFWWPDVGENGPEGLFSVSDTYMMTYFQYDNGDINLVGQTELNGCVTDLDVWFVNRKDFDAWSAGGGLFKQELEYGSCADVIAENLFYYVVDDSRSTMTASGCGERDGTYTVEHRPSDFTYAIQVGPGGALFDFGDDFGISGWAYAVDADGNKDILDFNLVLECEDQLGGCETAFARGVDGATCFADIDDAFGTDYDFSRWGWTIGPLSEGDYTYDVYAGAGQCDISKGALVGTVDVSFNNGEVDVTYNIDPAYSVDETHTFVGSTPVPFGKNGRPTVAPGQYYIEDNLGDEIFVIAHAVVCGD